MAKTIYEQFRMAALEHASVPFLVYPRSATRDFVREGAEISYGTALSIIDELAERYSSAGYGPGHRVAMVLGNRPEHFFHLFALNRIGASAVLLNPEYLDHEFAYAISLPECSLVLGASPRIDDLTAIAARLPTPVPVVDGTVNPGRFSTHAPAYAPMCSSPNPEDLEAVIVFTSGTTGRPKGCMISNLSCLAAGESYASAGGLIAFEPCRERIYNPLPSFHMNLSIFLLNAMTRVNGCIVTQDRFHASSWWRDIVEGGATAVHYMGIIPPLLLRQEPTAEEKHHTVRFGFGAGVDPIVRAQFEERFGFPLIEGWGMTETSRTIQNSALPRCLVDRAFGRVRPPLEARIADVNDEPMPLGEPGEFLIRCSGPNPRHGFFSGYVNQPEETEQAWRNGWFHTGDVVKQLPDGVLVFVERRKNIIRRSGENIAAAEVEQALAQSAVVQSVAALSVADAMHDEEVMACVIPVPGIPRTRQTALVIMAEACRRLARHKLPAWIAFIDDIPVTGTQKVRRNLIFPTGLDPREDPRTIDLRAEKRRIAVKTGSAEPTAVEPPIGDPEAGNG